MPVLEIITIGTELLLGEITDTNSTYIARTLRDHGIDIYRITTIGDNPGRIASAIQEAMQRAEIIITTGGLGPTVDDPTRQAVADAVGCKLVFVDELWEQIVERFKAYGRAPTHNNRRQAFIPQGATAIPNPVGTAPCFILEHDSTDIISLPGVPQEMKHILHHAVIPLLKDKYQLESQTIKATVLHVAALGESRVDELIEDLERYTNPTVGLLAHPGQVDVRVTAKARSEAEALEMIHPIVEELHRRLGDHIYGQNGDTLPGVIHALLEKHDQTLILITTGFDDDFGKAFAKTHTDRIKITSINSQPADRQMIIAEMEKAHQNQNSGFVFGLSFLKDAHVNLHAIDPQTNQITTETHSYGGPRENARLWAENIGLDILRRKLTQFIRKKETGEA